MNWLTRRFAWWHFWTALALWIAFSAFELWIVSHGLDNARDRPMTIAATTIGTSLGPMTGAISRGFQGCCLQFSLTLLPYCLAALGAGAIAQVALPPKPAWVMPVRVIAWLGGWFVWFGGGVVSLGHALS